MNDLKIFKNETFGEVRVIQKDGQPWFFAKDICEVLEIGNPSQALSRLEDDERNTIILNEGIGNPQKSIVNEYGLYNLVLGSRKPEAKQFKRWITHDVLPSIRKHGMYATDKVVDQMLNDPDTMIKTLQAYKEERLKRIDAETKVEEMKPKALFADAVSTSKTSISIGELAKILNQNCYETGQNRLFEQLRNEGYLIKRIGSDRNLPTQCSMELGLMEIKETAISGCDGEIRINKTTKITGKGQRYFVNKFLKELLCSLD